MTAVHSVASGFGMTWAVGGTAIGTAILRREGSSWHRVPTPDIGPVRRAVVASDVDVWAVGLGHCLHWDGHRWHEVPMPTRRGERTLLAEFAAFGPDALYCVGQATRLNDPWQARGVVQRWDGTHWHELALPDVARYWGLFGVDGASPDDVWVVGADAEQPIILHWDGRAWTRTPIPATGPGWGQLTEVVALAAHDVWATGGLATRPGSNAMRRCTQALAMHWDGRHWSLARPPSEAVHVDQLIHGDGQIWALGRALQDEPSLSHWDGARWNSVPAPDSFVPHGGAALPDDSGLLLVGHNGRAPLVAAYHW
ncbi:MAG TPA: hypothetical protein VHZ97_12390 [Pseudonocardiaceae bacterium]|nr:hypothetical protein [Pseudonocardiaceae bacterium]